MKIIIGILIMVAVITLACYLWPQINFRKMPKGLCTGELDEKLPNWVSSLVDKKNSHFIQPLEIKSLSGLAEKITTNLPHITFVKEDNHRIIAYRQSTIYHFTDWICIESNGDVTSSATMGHSDFNKNRQLVESIRQIL